MARSRTKTVAERIEEAMREIGVLLIAFAPLDTAFAGARSAIGWALLFFLAGLFLFGVALRMGRSRGRGH